MIDNRVFSHTFGPGLYFIGDIEHAIWPHYSVSERDLELAQDIMTRPEDIADPALRLWRTWQNSHTASQEVEGIYDVSTDAQRTINITEPNSLMATINIAEPNILITNPRGHGHVAWMRDNGAFGINYRYGIIDLSLTPWADISMLRNVGLVVEAREGIKAWYDRHGTTLSINVDGAQYICSLSSNSTSLEHLLPAGTYYLGDPGVITEQDADLRRDLRFAGHGDVALEDAVTVPVREDGVLSITTIRHGKAVGHDDADIDSGRFGVVRVREELYGHDRRSGGIYINSESPVYIQCRRDNGSTTVSIFTAQAHYTCTIPAHMAVRAA